MTEALHFKYYHRAQLNKEAREFLDYLPGSKALEQQIDLVLVTASDPFSESNADEFQGFVMTLQNYIRKQNKKVQHQV